MSPRTLCIALLASALAACGEGRDGSPPEETEIRSEAAAPGPVVRDPLTDADIEVLVSLINGSEIAGATAVQPKLVWPESRAFAQMLIEDHSRLREGLPRAEGPARPPLHFATLRAVTHAQSGMFATLPAGPGFDAFFVAAQAGMHSTVLDSLHHWRTLAQGAGLRAALGSSIVAVERHLERALALQATLGERMPDPDGTPVRPPEAGPSLRPPAPSADSSRLPPASRPDPALPPDTAAAPSAGPLSPASRP